MNKKRVDKMNKKKKREHFNNKTSMTKYPHEEDNNKFGDLKSKNTFTIKFLEVTESI